MAWWSSVTDAIGLPGSPYPNNPDERYEIWHSRDDENELDALDARLNTLETMSDADARLGVMLADFHH